LQAEIQQIAANEQPSVIINVARPIKECIDAAQQWIDTLPLRKNDSEALIKEVRFRSFFKPDFLMIILAGSKSTNREN
jgi:hypothetical protein